jgi:type IV pilus assembly protein PilA
MLYRLRQRSSDESGFTLIELLVVILIIGILAAIAIPSFINQKGKANDAASKEQARTMQTAAETFASDNNGSYASLKEVKQLQEIEPSLKDETASKPLVAKGTETTFEVEAENVTTKDKFKISRNAEGVVTRSCTVPEGANRNGCPANEKW